MRPRQHRRLGPRSRSPAPDLRSARLPLENVSPLSLTEREIERSVAVLVTAFRLASGEHNGHQASMFFIAHRLKARSASRTGRKRIG